MFSLQRSVIAGSFRPQRLYSLLMGADSDCPYRVSIAGFDFFKATSEQRNSTSLEVLQLANRLSFGILSASNSEGKCRDPFFLFGQESGLGYTKAHLVVYGTIAGMINYYIILTFITAR